MKTFKKLCKRFEKIHPGFTVWLDEINSYKGYYNIAITRLDFNITSYHIFESCKDFKNWMDNVILD